MPTREEADGVGMMQKTWATIAGPGNLEALRSDPLMFPAKASMELLAKMPPTVVWESEFDLFITPTTRWGWTVNHQQNLIISIHFVFVSTSATSS